MHSLTDRKCVKVGGRSSPLSKVQIEEVYTEFRKYHPEMAFEVKYYSTFGDVDRLTSLRSLDKTDFFTREIDEALLAGEIDVAIHSAKDLPEPIRAGLEVVAITKGLDASDSLVLRNGVFLEDLTGCSVIATSSARREDAVLKLRKGLQFVDIRGTIQERLDKLSSGEVDGVVIAEAALIRLNLTHLNRVRLPGDTTPNQGRLAIVGRQAEPTMRSLFKCLDA